MDSEVSTALQIAAPLAFTLGEDLAAAATAPYANLDCLQSFFIAWLKQDVAKVRNAGFEPREADAARAFCNFVATYRQQGPKAAAPHQAAYVRALLGGAQ